MKIIRKRFIDEYAANIIKRSGNNNDVIDSVEKIKRNYTKGIITITGAMHELVEVDSKFYYLDIITLS